jgi:hypothetical protein
MELHKIPCGLYCVPAALYAITGADLQSVIVPALNRHMYKKNANLFDTPAGVKRIDYEAVLNELGYHARRYKDGSVSGNLRVHVATWANRSLKWPNNPLLASTNDHCLVIQNGKVWDNHAPLGCDGKEHPFAKTIVVQIAMIQKKN